MDPEQVERKDFPTTSGGYDPATVDAHLAAVAAALTALKARIRSFEVERETLRRQAATSTESAEFEVMSEASAPDPEPAVSAPPEPIAPAEPVKPGVPKPQPPGIPAQDEVSARLVATKMALDGADREAIRKRLEETYDLEDPDALIDDVLERVG